MRQNTLSIHSENILPIIKKWLYSSRDIFLRELVSNSSDAIKKVRILQGAKQIEQDDPSLSIQIQIDKENKTLTISDNGIGMTEEEVEKYIAQIAFSGAEEFIEKYRSQSEKDPMIGHFGLGFFSSYMVASNVEIETLSFLPNAKPVHWSCDGSSTYQIGEGQRTKRGTDVILHLDEESLEYLNESRIRELLNRYCLFVADPIYLNDQPFGNEDPLWIKPPAQCTDSEYLAFYRKLYPQDQDPVFWIHLNVDYPFQLQGILYFPKITRPYDNTNPSIRLYCNRVFVSEHCRDFLPEHLTILRGAIDSPDIPLNVSRSYLQVDQKVRQLSSHITKKISDRLRSLLKTDREKYISLWKDIEQFVKSGILQDQHFAHRLNDVLIWKNSNGDWTTTQEYLDRAKEKKIYYSLLENTHPIHKAFLDKGIEILFSNSTIDVIMISFLEREFKEISFHRIDSTLDPSLLDESREKTLLDADGKSLASKIGDIFRSNLTSPIEIEAKSLVSDELPALVVIDENMKRIYDYLHFTRGTFSESDFKKKLVVNTNNKLVQAAYRLSATQPVLAGQLVHQIFDLACLGQKMLEPAEVEKVISKNQQLLEQLTALI